MKFQNPSLNSVLTGRTDGRTDERTSRNQYAPHFFKVGGIMSCFLCCSVSYPYLFSPINFLIILYQLTKFEAPSCTTFGDKKIK